MAVVEVQYGALPWRLEGGEIQILLITTRTTGRWMAPKGSQMKGREPHEAAALEAFEEAGIRGQITTTPVGAFHYDKVRKSGAVERLRVDVFALAVAEELDTWPEAHQRERRWFSREEAASAVLEEELAALIAEFSPIR